jgi:hypothetical protein
MTPKNKDTYMKYHGKGILYTYIYRHMFSCISHISQAQLYAYANSKKKNLWNVFEKENAHSHNLTLSHTQATWAKAAPKIRGMQKSRVGCCKDEVLWKMEQGKVSSHTRRCVRVRVWVCERVCACIVSLLHLSVCACTCLNVSVCTSSKKKMHSM